MSLPRIVHPYRGFWPSAIPRPSGASLLPLWGSPGAPLGLSCRVKAIHLRSQIVHPYRGFRPSAISRPSGASLVPSWGSPGAVWLDLSHSLEVSNRHPYRRFGPSAPPKASLGSSVCLLALSGASWHLLEPTGALPLGAFFWCLLNPSGISRVFTQIRMEPFRRHVSGSPCTFRSPYYL